MIDNLLLRETVLGRIPPASIEQVGRNVYKVTLSSGPPVALKRLPEGVTPDPLEVESSVLMRLHGMGCPVPEVHLVEPSLRLLVTAWAGDRTMDDICQEGDAEALQRAGEGVAEGLCRIEAAMAGEARPGEELVLRTDAEGEAAGILQAARQGMEAVLGSDARDLRKASGRLERMTEGICREARSIASLDYNARNVVIGPDGVRFVDFPTVGWDWPERRFVQYVTGLGAYRRGGRLVSPLTRDLAEGYARLRCTFDPDADAGAVLRAVDAHDLLFHLVLLARLFRVWRSPDAAESRLLRRAWDGVEERIRQATRHLGRPLSEDPEVGALRDFFQNRG